METVARRADQKARRTRPEDGGVVWHPGLNAFECLGCEGRIAVQSRRVWTNPERLLAFKEMLVIDHTECWQFDDPKMAADARKYRSERKRRENLKARAAAVLDRQAVSWRGQ